MSEERPDAPRPPIAVELERRESDDVGRDRDLVKLLAELVDARRRTEPR